jgi:TfoX/Sxy family transcriptional regulator of competence genes
MLSRPGQFDYVKNATLMKMSYYLAADKIFDDLDPDLAELWARRAREAALRAEKPVRRKKSLN